MILGKLWRFFRAQANRLANYFRKIDPIAELQLECDLATEQMKQGREGLEQHRGLVERLRRQTGDGQRHIEDLSAKVQAYLTTGERETAGRFALELQGAQRQLQENEQQLDMLERAYNNNLLKVKHAGRKIDEVRNRIARYDAELKMSRTEAEIAKLASSLDFDVSTDFGQVEQLVQEKIDANRAVVRVAADLSGQGIEDVRRAEDVERARGEEALKLFEAAKRPTLPAPEKVE